MSTPKPTAPKHDWRTQLFKNIPTRQEQSVQARIDEEVSAKICVIEPIAPPREEIDAFLRVKTATSKDGYQLDVFFVWKGIPIVKVIRQDHKHANGARIIVAALDVAPG